MRRCVDDIEVDAPVNTWAVKAHRARRLQSHLSRGKPCLIPMSNAHCESKI